MINILSANNFVDIINIYVYTYIYINVFFIIIILYVFMMANKSFLRTLFGGEGGDSIGRSQCNKQRKYFV